MTARGRIWLRAESRPTERRAPVTPVDAGKLVADGVLVTVEESAQRIFPIEDYATAGCRVAEAGSWTTAPDDAFVLGLKELPNEPAALRHRHVFFGHAYKGQTGATRLLRRFTDGGGTLLDLEYLTDDTGRRLAAFGFWAGYLGGALAVLHHRGRLETPVHPTSKSTLDEKLKVRRDDPVTALVLGALGRCGQGAIDAFTTAGISPTRWDLEETRDLDRRRLLEHDILLNAVLATTPTPPFLTQHDLAAPRRLTVVTDVTCDVGSACNVLPIYDHVTSWAHPVRRLHAGPPPLDIIAIDNLPSLLPKESSTAFAADLLPHLRGLVAGAEPWRRCAGFFRTAVRSTEEQTHV